MVIKKAICMHEEDYGTSLELKLSICVCSFIMSCQHGGMVNRTTWLPVSTMPTSKQTQLTLQCSLCTCC